MKVLKYNFCTRVNLGTEEAPRWEEILSPVEMGWNEANEEIARKEAHNGEYTIVDNGEPEPEENPSQLDTLEAQVAYTAMMTGTLLEV